MKIKKGDTVKVIAGDERGKSAVVKEVLVKENKVIVEGINLVKKHTKPSAKNPQGGILSMEAPINISNVMLVDGKTATRVGRKVVDGKVQRFAKKTDKILD
ncbi:MAG: 50S ribosomal protein L24 [Bacteroidetes bacterium]|nr:50S ribosomal protein L24 [Bacteroidota bacterium]